MNQNTITLRELADPCSTAPTNVTINLSLSSKRANAFSLPPFLLYAMKAKQVLVSRRGEENSELDLLNREGKPFNVSDFTLAQLREDARQHHLNVKMSNLKIDRGLRSSKSQSSETLMSAYMQAHCFYQLVNTDGDVMPMTNAWQGSAVNHYVVSIPKNVTVPAFLMDYLTRMFGSEKCARLYVFQKTTEVHEAIAAVEGFHETLPGKKGKFHLKPPYDETSWARKLHNAIYADMVRFNSSPKEGLLGEIMDIPLIREVEMEHLFTKAGRAEKEKRRQEIAEQKSAKNNIPALNTPLTRV